MERIAIAPVFSFDFGKNTTLTVEGEYQRSSVPDYDSLPAVGTVLPNPFGRVPKSRFLDDPNLENQIYRDTLVGYRLQHKFSDNWSVRNAFNAEIFDVDEDIVSLALDPNNRTVRRNAFRGTTDVRYYTLQTDVLFIVRLLQKRLLPILGICHFCHFCRICHFCHFCHFCRIYHFCHFCDRLLRTLLYNHSSPKYGFDLIPNFLYN